MIKNISVSQELIVVYTDNRTNKHEVRGVTTVLSIKRKYFYCKNDKSSYSIKYDSEGVDVRANEYRVVVSLAEIKEGEEKEDLKNYISTLRNWELKHISINSLRKIKELIEEGKR